MKAELFKPSASLNRYIDSYMLVDIDGRNTAGLANVWRLFAYGKVSMLFLYGDPPEYSQQGATEPMQHTGKLFWWGN